MPETNHLQIIQQAVESFVRGDLEAVLAAMSEDVDFRPSGPPSLLPWARPRRGPREVAQYLEELLGAAEYESFEPEKFFADEDEVVVVGRARMRMKATGRRFETGWTLRFELAGGKVVRYRDSWDTGTALEALGLTTADPRG